MRHYYQERKRKKAIVIIVVSLFLGMLYPIIGLEFDDKTALINGTIIGFLGGLFIAIFELYVSNPQNKKIKFVHNLISKSIIYVLFFILLIIIVKTLTGSIVAEKGFFSYLTGPEIQRFIFEEDFYIIVLYAIFLSSAVNFIHQISRKLGQNVLWNFISGKYRTPREEERIFMFLDVNHSTVVADKLGDVQYNNLLNDIFFDLTNSILSTYGEIYRYVGDEVVITWKLKKGLRHANCIRTFFRARYAIKLKREKYMTKYGFVPTFSAGYHYGKVIIGEIGDVKSQISFFGETLYTAASIEKHCKIYKKDNLVSEQLMKRISLPDIFEMKIAGTLNQANNKSIDLYTISEIEMASS